MPFPPPTAGYEDRPIAESLDDYLVPKKSAIHPLKAKNDLQLMNICKGDVLTIELGRNPHQGSVGLVDYQGEQFLAVWWWQPQKRRWYIQTDDRQGAVTEDMTLIGIARALIKDQMQ